MRIQKAIQKVNDKDTNAFKPFTLDPHITYPRMAEQYNIFKALHATRKSLMENRIKISQIKQAMMRQFSDWQLLIVVVKLA